MSDDRQGASEEGRPRAQVMGPAPAPSVADSADDSSTAQPPRERGRARLWLRIGVVGLVGLILVAFTVLTQTATGQRIVLNEILDRIRGAMAGQLTVGDIRSRTLLAELTLIQVRLDAEGDRRVLDADSVVFRYSPLSLLMGSPRVQSSTFHGLDLEISRHSGEDVLNVQRILAPDEPATTTSPGPPTTLELGRISVRGGRIVVLTPVEEAGRATETDADGNPMRRLSLEEVDLDLEQTVLRPGGAVAFDARLASFAAAVRIVEQPLVVQAAVGDLTFGAEGLRIEGGMFRLPGSLLSGELGVGPDQPGEPWAFTADLGANDWGDLRDLQWIDARIPTGTFRGAASLRTGDGLSVALRDVEVRGGGSSVVATGRARFDDGLVLDGMVVTANPIATADLRPWIGRDVPLEGFLSGQATVSGTVETLHVDGRLTLVPTGVDGPPTTADFAGTWLRGDNPGADGLVVRLDPLNYRVIEPWWPRASALSDGTASFEVDGRADDGVLVVADLTHVTDTSQSHVFGRGLFRRTETGDWTADVSGDLAPMSLALLERMQPEIDLTGSVSGPVTIEGSLDDLRFEGDLVAGGGRLSVSGSIDLAALGSSFAVDADAESVDLGSLTGSAPQPSVVSAHITVQGSGLSLDSLEGVASVTVRQSLVGPVRVRSAAAEVRASGGMLTIDTLEVDVSGARVAGSGTLGLTSAAIGDASFALAIDSLLMLRPMIMGDSIMVRDGLSPLEQDLLRARGIDPDTLPAELDVRMTGVAHGTADVRGHLGALDVQIAVEALDVAYRRNQVTSAQVVLAAAGLPDMSGEWMASVRAQGITWEQREFEEIDFDGTMNQRRGEGTMRVLRGENEAYAVTGAFALDSIGGEVALADATARIDDQSWELSVPTRIAWGPTSVSVDSLELRRVGEGDQASITARGALARGGESDFRLDLEGFDVLDATRLLQREDVDVSGLVDLSVTVSGPAEGPSLDVLFQVVDPRYGALQLTRLSGSLQYRDRLSDFRVDAWDGIRNVLSASGTLPFDLALAEVEERTLDEPMDVRVTADGLDASIVLAYLSSLEDVAGTISADLLIGGTSREPAPSGTVGLADGAWTIGALGVRHTNIGGELELRPDRTVAVRLSTSGEGSSTVSGVVTMEPFSDPALDLLVTLDQFQAVSRRDIEGMLSGSFAVRGRYRLPVAEGSVRVDQGTLFVDEFARSANVIDLRDPTLFAGGFAVDTTVFVTQPLIADLRNPFLDNLRVDIELSVPRDLWIRSDEMNVEIGGDLLVRYDRGQGDLVMVGDLQALRGSYLVLGRTFEVDGGTVSFVGQPGVNPALAIEAVSRIRRRQGERLEVRATVTGTLVQPLVTLSTTEAGLSQSDLISYLVMGVPSGDLGISAGGAGSGGAGAALGEGAMAGGVTFVTGQLASQVGTALAQGVGFDYLAISQGDVGVDQSAGFFNTAQFEVGRYFGDDVFVVLVLSGPSQNQGVGGLKPLRGVRVELALTEEWFVEGFVEDRFLRGSSGALAQTGLDGEEIVGALIFRDWGYGSQEQE